MRLFEFQYSKRLNPKLWEGSTLKPEVREKLLEITKEFIEYIDVEQLEIEDVVLTGSNANFNWTNSSDVDLHLLVDMSEMSNRCPEFTEDFFQDKKTLWNEHHEISIYDHPVEVYVQDANEEHHSTGIFSIKDNQWVVKPEYSKPSIDGSDVKQKANQYAYLIKKLITTSGDIDDVDKLKEKIRKFRQAGLDENGEFSTENLAFKLLRNSGLLQKLTDYARRTQSEKLSLS